MKTIAALSLALASLSASADVTVPMHLVDAQGTSSAIGEITISRSPYGLVFSPTLEGLSAGLHGFHLHQNGSCAPAEKAGKLVPGGGAGGHYDPEQSGRHDTPWGNGHRGDLPPLIVAEDGRATQPVLAPRLSLEDLAGRALIIHAGGDNHADHPAALGGGGARVACGVIAP